VKSGGTVSLSTGGQARASGVLAGVRDGAYLVGFRAHHLDLDPPAGDAIPLPGTVTVAEITGSESYVHLDCGGHAFVALSPGVRRLEPGTALAASVDPRRLFLFGEDGALAASDLPRAA
jgi:glycerol transport system ATP-binding protein